MAVKALCSQFKFLHTWQDPSNQASTAHISGGEILDEIITRSRGEFRHTHSPKTTSSTPTSTSIGDIRPANSPQTRRIPSPRLTVLRGESNLGSTGKEMKSMQIPSPWTLILGKDINGSPSS
ncbi:putative boron transporter 2 isoform X1 [Sesbania bispinosa]|nr:putative boron transporter 2 isoform X1 [Sesbania bispinosa]